MESSQGQGGISSKRRETGLLVCDIVSNAAKGRAGPLPRGPVALLCPTQNESHSLKPAGGGGGCWPTEGAGGCSGGTGSATTFNHKSHRTDSQRFPTKKTPGTTDFLSKFHQPFREERMTTCPRFPESRERCTTQLFSWGQCSGTDPEDDGRRKENPQGDRTSYRCWDPQLHGARHDRPVSDLTVIVPYFSQRPSTVSSPYK